MAERQKPYKGMGIEGPIATWYAKNASRDLQRFITVAQAVTDRVALGSAVLEAAPGPGFCAIEIARCGRYRVTGLDISASFVQIARANAAKAGVSVDFQHGNVAAMPFSDESFDFVICTAAFKNFSDPLGVLNEIHRVLKPGGRAAILDLRKEASREEIAAEVGNMHLTAVNAFVTRWIFRVVLLKRAYTREAVETLVARSRFGAGEFEMKGITFELRLGKPLAIDAKPPETQARWREPNARRVGLS